MGATVRTSAAALIHKALAVFAANLRDLCSGLSLLRRHTIPWCGHAVSWSSIPWSAIAGCRSWTVPLWLAVCTIGWVGPVPDWLHWLGHHGGIASCW